ncbi:MAG: TetR/AcrR family transcriptional regulator, partial [Chitinophagaceae bacterium]
VNYRYFVNHLVKYYCMNELSTEQKILNAAKKVFVTQGMAAARMQDIADEAGINKALLHYYFRNKEQLFAQIFAEARVELIPKINEILRSDLPLFDKIRQFVARYIDIIKANPYLPLFVLNEMNRNPLTFSQTIFQNETPQLDILLTQLEVAMDNGEIKPTNPMHLIINMMGLCIFPFVGKPMIQMMMQLNDEQFLNLMEQRKTIVADFIIQSIKK